MGNFRSNNRGGFGNRSGGRSFGGSSRGRGGFGGGRDFGRRNTEMHSAVCAKCGEQCQIPFKPTGDKPVFCSDCFRQNEGSGNSRNRAPQSDVSSEQLKQINSKLDKIILILQDLELDVDGDLDDEEDEDLDDDEDENAEDDSEADL